MSPELKDLLDDAARTPERGLDVADIHARGRRSRRRQRAGGVLAAVALIGGAAIGITELVPSETTVPPIDQAPSVAPSPAETAEETPGRTDGGSTLPSIGVRRDLGVDVLVVGGYATDDDPDVVSVVRPASVSHLSITGDEPGIADAAQRRVVPDGAGGLFGQVLGERGSGAVVHVAGDGTSEVLLPAIDGFEESYTLVGGGAGSALVQHRTGTTPDTTTMTLLELVPGGDPRPVVETQPAWEAGFDSAAGLEVLLYTISGEAQQALFIDPPDGPQVELWSGLADGQGITDVTVGPGGVGYATLVEGDSLAEQTVDLLHIAGTDGSQPRISDRTPIPLRADVDEASAEFVRVTSISAAGSLVVVNRTVDGSPIQPLVWDRDADATAPWFRLDVEAEVHLGRASELAGDPEPAPACATEDATLRNAPPVDGLSLYLSCSGDAEPWHAYRVLLDESTTGDPEADAAIVLDALFGTLPQGVRDRGYVGLDLDTYPDDRDLTDPQLASVSFAEGTIVVDFDAPDGYGNYGTSYAGAVFHTLLAANLLQLPEVDTVEVRNGGSCEAHSTAFESDGCFRFTEDEHAPWIVGDARG